MSGHAYTEDQLVEQPAIGLFAELGWQTVSAMEGLHMFDRITHDPNLLSGRATLRGLRISVAHVLNLVANGMTPAQIVSEHPDLEDEDVRQALAYAAELARARIGTNPA